MICIDCRSEYTIKATLLKMENGTVVLNAYSMITKQNEEEKEEDVIFWLNTAVKNTFINPWFQKILFGSKGVIINAPSRHMQ